MTADRERWRRVSALLDQALDLPPQERAAMLEAECDGDAALRAEVEALLAADADDSPLDDGAALLAGEAVAALGDAEDARSGTGSRIGPWRLERMLGRGGMGVVFAAHRDDGDTLQRAAVKRMRGGLDGEGQLLRRFLQERRILAALSHPGIPRLLDHGVDDDGRPWFALELVEGLPLQRHADQRRLALRERIELFREVCAAVQHAHEHFVVHRDLKPSNILVDGDGRPRVLDFGVAKRIDDDTGNTRTGMFAGFTPEYAAPEQASGGPVTAATDVYALGVVLYQLLSGRLPYAFDHGDLRATVDAIATADAARLDQALTTGTPDEVERRMRDRGTDVRGYRRFVRGDLSRIVQGALAKEPARRYSSVQAFAADLGRFLDGRTVSVTGDTWGYRARKFVRRNRWGVAMAVVAAAAIAGGVTGVALQSREATAAAQRAEAEAARAEREAARARSDAETLSATNEFLRGVFEGANPYVGGSPQVTLKEALDRAVTRAEESAEMGAQARVRVLLAASSSYEGMGDAEEAERVVRRALAIQQKELPESKEDRARVLAALAWVRLTYEPEQALAWAKEAYALERSLDPPSRVGLQIAMSVLSGAQHFSGDVRGALQTLREARKEMLGWGIPPESADIATTYQNEGFMLAALEDWEAAYAAHREALRIRTALLGEDATGTANEHVFYGFTLNHGGRHAEALAQFEQAMPVLAKTLEPDSDSMVQARVGRGAALLGVGRYREAADELAVAHAHGRDHGFDGRQAGVAHSLAKALARTGDCAGAAAVVDEMATRAIPLPEGRPPPLDGSGCTR